MNKEYLPIGSVVLLKGADKRLMIFGIMPINLDEDKQHDYIGCLYPEGFLGSESTYLFNSEDIDKIDFIGFTDIEHQAFVSALNQHLENEKEVADGHL